MPVFTIETPSGRKLKIEAPDQDTAIRGAQEWEAGQQAQMQPKVDPRTNQPPGVPEYVPPGVEGYNPQTGEVSGNKYKGGSFMAATEGSHAGLMGGFDDEITAGMLAPVDAAIDWFKGNGFDMGRAYTRKQQMLDAQKGARREEHPVASIAGEVAGGLAMGAGASRAGLTLANIPAKGIAARAGLGALEGAGYGALYGAGEAKPGERFAGAGLGAAVGGITGGAMGAIGGALANRSARNSMPAITDSADIKAASRALYDASEREGVRYQGSAVQRLGQNMKVAAGRPNERLRPITLGMMDDIDAMFTGDMPLEVMDEFRKGLNQELRRAKPSDRTTLAAMKRVLDGFIDGVTPGTFTGDAAKATGLLREAQKNWATGSKMEAIERILDVAEVDGAGKYTQSGFANAVVKEMRGLYKQIAKGKAAQNWSKEEIALIRQMAMGGSNSRIVNMFAKFAPRGVVSILAGQGLGSLVPAVGNVAVPLLGHAAGQAADRGAMQAAQTLQRGIQTGTIPQMPFLPNRLMPLVPGAVSPSMGTGQSLATSPRR